MDDLMRLAAEFDRARQQAPGKVRGALGRGVNRGRDEARRIARGRGWSTDTVDGIYSRMARGTSGDPTAYLFATGAAAHQEAGTSRHGPQPTITPGIESQLDSIAKDILQVAGGL